MTPEPSDPDPPQSPGQDCAITLLNPCRYREVAARRLRPWVGALIAALAPEARSLTLRFVSDREMRSLNRTFRHKDRTTDVLSFPGDLDPGARDAGSGERTPADPEAGHLGDIAIAVPTAERQALTAGHSVIRELRVLILHGVLHCMGHDHETDDGSMERLESRLADRWIADA